MISVFKVPTYHYVSVVWFDNHIDYKVGDMVVCGRLFDLYNGLFLRSSMSVVDALIDSLIQINLDRSEL